MAINCTCNNTLQNTGSPDCPPVMQIARKFIFVPKYDSAGNENRLLKADVDKAEMLIKINETNALNRYFPSAQVDNVEDTRAEPVTQEFSSGKIITVRDGARTAISYIPLGSTQELGHYQSFGCADFGCYIMDAGGNFIYYDKGDDYAYPIQVDNETFNAMLIKATDAEVQMVMLTWQWKLNQKDANLRFIASDSLDFDVEDLNGLFDTTAAYSNQATTGFSVLISESDFGIGISDILTGDVTAYDNSGASPVAAPLSSWTESTQTEGFYSAVFTTPQSSGDTLYLDIAKNGYDWSGVKKVVLTIP